MLLTQLMDFRLNGEPFSGLIWSEIKAIWNDGLEEYASDLWNIVDFITNVCYVAWISLRLCSWYIVRVRGLKFQIVLYYWQNEFLERKFTRKISVVSS